MKFTRILAAVAAGALLICTTGCFRVSSDTRALRDVALEFGAEGAEEKIELGVGFFTMGLAKFGTRFVEGLPPEVNMILGSVKGVECSVYELSGRQDDISELMIQADAVMQKRGLDRVVGVIDKKQLVAVYIPREVKSHRNMSMSVLVLTERELVCASASGDLEAVVQLAFQKAQEHRPAKSAVAAAF